MNKKNRNKNQQKQQFHVNIFFFLISSPTSCLHDKPYICFKKKPWFRSSQYHLYTLLRKPEQTDLMEENFPDTLLHTSSPIIHASQPTQWQSERFPKLEIPSVLFLVNFGPRQMMRTSTLFKCMQFQSST